MTPQSVLGAQQCKTPDLPRPANSCRKCGLTNYHRLIARDAAGVIRHNGSYQCSGCQLNFTQPAEWRTAPMGGDLASVPERKRAAMQDRPGLAHV